MSARASRADVGPASAPPSPHLRPRDGSGQSTTALELFFDLVYVFAVTQLSELLISHLSFAGAGHAAFLLLVIWWAWIYTTWMVNWFDPTSGKVRLLLLLVGLASLLMAAAIPHAFTSNAPLFAGAYVALQVGRNVAGAALLGREQPLRIVFERLVAWSVLTGALWLGGAFVPSWLRFALWGPALFLDLIAPLAGYRTPGLGSSTPADYPVEGGHFAERFQAFIIIALGESIVATGAAASAGGLATRTVGALAVAFLITGTLWWLYFGEIAENSRRRIAEADDPGSLARDAYTYLHVPIVAGIIMVAVGDHLLIVHPIHALSTAGAIMMLGGPAMYLFGETLFRIRMIGSVNPKRVVAILALCALGAAGSLPAVALAGAVAAVLVALGWWEWPPVRRVGAEAALAAETAPGTVLDGGSR